MFKKYLYVKKYTVTVLAVIFMLSRIIFRLSWRIALSCIILHVSSRLTDIDSIDVILLPSSSHFKSLGLKSHDWRYDLRFFNVTSAFTVVTSIFKKVIEINGAKIDFKIRIYITYAYDIIAALYRLP